MVNEAKYINTLRIIRKWIDNVKSDLINLGIQVDKLIGEEEKK